MRGEERSVDRTTPRGTARTLFLLREKVKKNAAAKKTVQGEEGKRTKEGHRRERDKTKRCEEKRWERQSIPLYTLSSTLTVLSKPQLTILTSSAAAPSSGSTSTSLTTLLPLSASLLALALSLRSASLIPSASSNGAAGPCAPFATTTFPFSATTRTIPSSELTTHAAPEGSQACRGLK